MASRISPGLRFAAVLAIATASLSGLAAAPTATDKPWFFVVATDPHVSGNQSDEKMWADAVEHVNRLKPDFLIVCGDLTSGSNNVKRRLKPKVMAADTKLAQTYNRIVARLDKSIKLYNVAGNHDVGVSPTPETVAWYTRHFGKPWYSVEHKGSLLVILESNLLRDASGGAKLANDELAWLKKTLADAKAKPYAHRMAFMHHPLYLLSVNEINMYPNIPRARRKQLLAMFKDAGVGWLFSGHMHWNSHIKNGSLEMIVTTTAAQKASKKSTPHGVRIVKVYPNRIEQKFYAYEDLPEKVTLEAK